MTDQEHAEVIREAYAHFLETLRAAKNAGLEIQLVYFEPKPELIYGLMSAKKIGETKDCSLGLFNAENEIQIGIVRRL